MFVCLVLANTKQFSDVIVAINTLAWEFGLLYIFVITWYCVFNVLAIPVAMWLLLFLRIDIVKQNSYVNNKIAYVSVFWRWNSVSRETNMWMTSLGNAGDRLLMHDQCFEDNCLNYSLKDVQSCLEMKNLRI